MKDGIVLKEQNSNFLLNLNDLNFVLFFCVLLMLLIDLPMLLDI
jgi:hypothetical protein